MSEDIEGRPRPAVPGLRKIVAAVEARPMLVRWLLAGPGALAAAILIMAAMPVWLPEGAAGVDNIVYPLVLAPLIWAVVFLYAVVESNLVRGVAVAVAAIVVNGAAVALAIAGVAA